MDSEFRRPFGITRPEPQNEKLKNKDHYDYEDILVPPTDAGRTFMCGVSGGWHDISKVPSPPAQNSEKRVVAFGHVAMPTASGPSRFRRGASGSLRAAHGRAWHRLHSGIGFLM